MVILVTNPPQPKRHNGCAIKTIRTIRGISRDDLANVVGVSYPYLANVENEHKDGTPELLHKIAMALDVPIAAILRGPIMATPAPERVSA
jgi:transcriptional regulator with XRE-family HTH domain